MPVRESTYTTYDADGWIVENNSDLEDAIQDRLEDWAMDEMFQARSDE